MADTIKLETTQAKFETKVNGETVMVDFTRMHPTWVAHFLLKAAQRRINDDLSGLDPKEKLEETRRILEEIYKGEPMPEKARKASSKRSVDPVQALALKTAKGVLSAQFEALTGMRKAADQAEHEKVAPFFTVKDGRAIWNDETVTAWIEKQATNGKRDYMQEARESLEGASDAMEGIDLDI